MLSEKKLTHLLLKKSSSIQLQKENLKNFLKKYYFKSLLTDIDFDNLLPQIINLQWMPQTCIFSQGDIITDYYFLVEGQVNLYKNYQSNCQERQFNKSGYECIGQYFYHNNIYRTHTAVSIDRLGSKGFKINKDVFHNILSNLVRQYFDTKQYLCNFLGITQNNLSKIQLYDHLNFEKYFYNHELIPNDSIYIIYEGQCMMSKKKQIQKQILPQMKPIVTYNCIPILNLCKNDCINLDNYFDKTNQYSYRVVSQQLILLKICYSSIPKYPIQLQHKLKIFHGAHLIKQQISQNVPISADLEATKKKKSCDIGKIAEIRRDYCLSIIHNPNIKSNRKVKTITQCPQGYFSYQDRQIKKNKVTIIKRQWKQYIRLPKIKDPDNPINHLSLMKF